MHYGEVKVNIYKCQTRIYQEDLKNPASVHRVEPQQRHATYWSVTTQYCAVQGRTSVSPHYELAIPSAATYIGANRPRTSNELIILTYHRTLHLLIGDCDGNKEYLWAALVTEHIILFPAIQAASSTQTIVVILIMSKFRE